MVTKDCARPFKQAQACATPCKSALIMMLVLAEDLPVADQFPRMSTGWSDGRSESMLIRKMWWLRMCVLLRVSLHLLNPSLLANVVWAEPHWPSCALPLEAQARTVGVQRSRSFPEAVSATSPRQGSSASLGCMQLGCIPGPWLCARKEQERRTASQTSKETIGGSHTCTESLYGIRSDECTTTLSRNAIRSEQCTDTLGGNHIPSYECTDALSRNASRSHKSTETLRRSNIRWRK